MNTVQAIPISLEFVAITPFQMGAIDAEKNELCLPELVYVRTIDRYEYCLGYTSVKPSILAEQTMSDYEQMEYEFARAIEPDMPILITDAAIEKWQALINF